MHPPTRPATLDEIYEELAALQRHPECADLLQYRSLVTAHQYRGLALLVRRWFPEGGEILDWGSGNGHFSYTLERLGFRATGYSFHEFGLRSHLSDAYRFARGTADDPASIPFPDASFDGVVSVGVLEHVRETGGTEEASLREIARVLRPGGRFVCWHFPNRFSWIEALTAVIPGTHHHRYRYGAADIRRLCDDAGLTCLSASRYGVLPRNSWHRAPAALRGSRRAARGWDLADRLLALAFRPFAQNWMFVAERPA